MVYINDLYLPLIAVKEVLEEKQTIYKVIQLFPTIKHSILTLNNFEKQEINSFPDSLEDFLIDLNIKSDNISIKTKNQTKDTNIDENEDIGGLLPSIDLLN